MPRRLDRAQFLRLCSGLGLVLGVESYYGRIQGSSTSASVKLTEADALQFQRRLFDAMIAHDLAQLGMLLDEKLIYIHIGGITQHSRQEFLDWVNTGPKFKTFELTEPRVFLYDDAFALTGRVESTSLVQGKSDEGTLKNQETVLHLVLSALWARKAPGWQLVLLQYTQIPNSK